MGDSVKKEVLLASVVLLVSLVLAGAGVATGWYLALRQFRAPLEAYTQGETLGALVAPGQRPQLAGVYEDGEAVDLDEISWSVPTAPAPFVGFTPAPGQHHNAFINPQQFRSGASPVLPKPRNTVRVFLTGGSVAYGTGAPSQDRIVSAYLERMLQARAGDEPTHFEVFTLASPGWASTHERILIENRLSELEPDLVISLSGVNDVWWGSQGRNVMWFRAQPDTFFFGLLDLAFRAGGRGPLSNVVGMQPTSVPPAVVAKRLSKNVRLAAGALAEQGVPYVFALQPTLSTTGKTLTVRERAIAAPNRSYNRVCYRVIGRHLRALERENFLYEDLTDVFDSLPSSEEIFIDTGHVGDKGNRHMAARLAKRVRKAIELRKTPDPS